MGFPGDLLRSPDIYIGSLHVLIWLPSDFLETHLVLIGLSLGPNGTLEAFKVPFWDHQSLHLGPSALLGSSNDLPICLMTSEDPSGT